MKLITTYVPDLGTSEKEEGGFLLGRLRDPFGQEIELDRLLPLERASRHAVNDVMNNELRYTVCESCGFEIIGVGTDDGAGFSGTHTLL